MGSSVRNARSQVHLTSATALLIFAVSCCEGATFGLHRENRFSRRRADHRRPDLSSINTNAGYVPMNPLVAGAELAAPPSQRTGLCRSARNGNFRCRDGSPFGDIFGTREARRDQTHRQNPAFCATYRRMCYRVRSLRTGWWTMHGSNWLPTTQSVERVSAFPGSEALSLCQIRL